MTVRRTLGLLFSLLIVAALTFNYGNSNAQNNPSERDVPQEIPTNDGSPEIGPNADKDSDKPHLLAGSYYNVGNGLTATLMLNNKGMRPLEVRPTLYASGGQRLDIAPVTVEATSFRMINLNEWATLGGAAFQQGSIQLFHRGRDLVLGAQIYLVDETHNLSFEEKLTEITNGGPSRLDGVWWLPHAGADVRLVLSNTTDAPLTVTADFAGATHNRSGAGVFTLASHETRVVVVNEGSPRNAAGVSQGNGKRGEAVAVSLTHSGVGGALLARAMVQDTDTGYSSTVQFSSPQAGKSSRLEGAGLRLKDSGGNELVPVVVARNVGQRVVTLRGRVPYTSGDGSIKYVKAPDTRIAAGDVQIIRLDQAIKKAKLPSDVSIAGLAFEHNGEAGGVIIAAHSMSADEDQVYRVPMWDPLAQRSPTGGYPWYVEGSSSTTVYIKNVTGREQQYVAHLVYPGGRYAFGRKSVKGGQTVEIDIRKLRNEQVPDEEGQTIPLDVTRGQIKWSLKQQAGSTDPYDGLALIGRSEQTDTALGISSNYACLNCCSDTFWFGEIRPGNGEMEVGSQVQFGAYETYEDCYGFFYTSPAPASWSSSNSGVASVSGGLVTANSMGDVSINASWQVTQYRNDPFCESPLGPSPVIEQEEDEPQPQYAGCGYTCRPYWYNTSASASVRIKPVVRITGANICDDRIDINLQPANVSGLLKVFLDYNGGSLELAHRPQQGGNTREYFYTVNLPNREFTGIRATWEVNNMVGTGTMNYRMQVLGDYLQTCYNVPLETDYAGEVVNAGAARIENNLCDWYSLDFRKQFLNEVNENGSGIDNTGTQMQIEGFCTGAPSTSPAYNNRRYRRPTNIRTQCITPLEIDRTVARGRQSSLTCGTQVFIAGIGCRIVEDSGGGLASDQLDNYKGVGVAACQGWSNPRLKTVRLF
jgi:hypothetical protein